MKGPQQMAAKCKDDQPMKKGKMDMGAKMPMMAGHMAPDKPLRFAKAPAKGTSGKKLKAPAKLESPKRKK